MRHNRKAVFIACIVFFVLALLAAGILLVSSLRRRQEYLSLRAITPTPSITPRTVQITEDPAYPTSTPTPREFRLNSVGIEVREMQTRLASLGYYHGVLDGEFGSATAEALKQFQAQNGLSADGIAGEQTLQRLYAEDAAVFTPTATPSPTPAILANGSAGDEVRALQQRLTALGYYEDKADGIFGKGTRAAVIAFQQQNGLDADGIAGQKTLALLYSSQAAAFVPTPTVQTFSVLSDSLPMLVNKEHPVDASFVPSDLIVMNDVCDASIVKIKYKNTRAVREAVYALLDMLEDAAKEGISNFQISAAYRSYSDQQSILNSRVSELMNSNSLSRSRALSAAKKTVAEPGASEHHTGLAFDITVPNTSTFLGTPQCKWLHEHCWDYGFILRYTADKEDITGFLAEAWHFRYVGLPHAQIMHEKNLCLEEYLQYASPAD